MQPDRQVCNESLHTCFSYDLIQLPEILKLFIEKTMVDEKSQQYSRTAEQEIWIYYQEIGLMETPVEQENAQEAELNERRKPP
ncbi:MAG: DUF4368 domain-containing protein [Oscillospiraceae bacterium]